MHRATKDRPDAPTGTVAQRAGVGIGTVFRHFPTKADLLAAVLDRRLEAVAEHAWSLAQADLPPAEAFDRFVRDFADSTATKHVLTDALAEHGIEAGPLAGEPRARFDAAVAQLLAEAQRTGTVRDDVDLRTLVVLLLALPRSPARSRALAVEVLLRGLRP